MSGEKVAEPGAHSTAFAALESKAVAGLYVVDARFVENGVVRFYVASENPLDEKPRGQLALRRLVARGLAGDVLDERTLGRVMDGPRVERWSRQKDGSWAPRGLDTILKAFAIPFGAMLLLFFAILANAGNLLQGLSEEKENRVVEVLMSSIDARSLCSGSSSDWGRRGSSNSVSGSRWRSSRPSPSSRGSRSTRSWSAFASSSSCSASSSTGRS